MTGLEISLDLGITLVVFLFVYCCVYGWEMAKGGPHGD